MNYNRTRAKLVALDREFGDNFRNDSNCSKKLFGDTCIKFFRHDIRRNFSDIELIVGNYLNNVQYEFLRKNFR